MRIGIDYLPAVSHAPGVGRYARELVRALAALEDRPELALYEVGRARRSIPEDELGLDGRPALSRLSRRTSRRLLAALPFGLGAADRALGGVDVFHHVLQHPPPVARALETIAISELPPRGSQADLELARVLARMSTVFVFCSEWRERVARRYALDAARVQHVPVGCEHWRRTLAELPARAEPPLVLVLGAQTAARRHGAVLAAAELLDEGGIRTQQLWIGRAAGASRELGRSLARSRVAATVRWRAEVPEADLPELVASASVLVHLSHEEGTPVTPLEALSLGVPVVASRLPCFEEALAGEAHLLENVDVDGAPDALADAIALAIGRARDPEPCRRGYALAEAYTWDACARATTGVWRTLA